MDVSVPHNLGREEVRRRLREKGHTIGDGIPGGMADVTTDWPSEDRMTLAINAMGQSLTGHIDIEDNAVRIAMQLPPALGFLKPIVDAAIHQHGAKLLEPPRD